MSISNSRQNYTQTLTGKVVVIWNPCAGRGKAGSEGVRLEALVREACSRRSVEWEILETAAAGHGIELARRAAAEGASLVVAAGGDGTLNEVLNGIMGTDAILGLLPMGTGNDVARCLELSKKLNENVDMLFDGVARPIDVGQMLVPSLRMQRWFLNVAGCGFDALVAQRANRGFPLLRGTAAYLAAVGATLVHLKPANLTLKLDGVTQSARALMCSVANSTSYGGGMKVAPDARLDDGLFDICLLREAGRLEFLRAFPGVFKGTHITHPRVSMYRAREVEIVSDMPLPLLIDGEVLGTTPVRYVMCERAIRIMAPVFSSAGLEVETGARR